MVKKIPNTKLAKLLDERGLSQTELYSLIIDKTCHIIGKDRISKIIRGITTNYPISTAKRIANALDVKIDDIID